MGVAEWLENHADRLSARQRAQADVAKLVVTFTTGVAATLVGTALQVSPTTKLDRAATWVLAAAVILTLIVLFLDRVREADHEALFTEARLRGWDDARLLMELRFAVVAAAQFNLRWLVFVRAAVAAQVSVAIVAGMLAGISLLRAPAT
jgi:hypothetical protein